MMAGIESGIQTILTYAADNRHGYELRQRDYDLGTDCAGLGRLYAASVEGVDVTGYPDCHSWDIADVLVGRGWQVMGFSEAAKQRGDILVRVDPSGGTGHVVVYLGDDRICEAANNYDGKRGDGSGREILERSYYSYGYKYIVRPVKKEKKPKVSIESVDGGVYRLYNPNSGQHLFTTDHAEAETLANAGWTYEGAPFKEGTGARVVRLYNPFGGAHMLTASDKEVVDLAIAKWVVEGVGLKQGTSKDVCRLYNPNNGDHVFTVDVAERDSLKAAGWTDEGVGFKAD